jgi:GTP-binding protein
MFIDRVTFEAKSGKGGDGRISFLREKNRPKGGPNGGNGGRGGSIYLRASSNVTSLVNYRHSKLFKAEDGEDGDIKDLYGKGGEDLYLDLPIGSVVFLEDGHKFLADLSQDGATFLLCKGGRGGKGNACFKNSRNKAPKIAENGQPGEKKRIVVELKLLADVGIIGFPNVGKSTFISLVTNSKAEIGDYDFTTLIPNLGVAKVKDGRSFVLADMPGLIAGAHLGKGLGLNFLRHIERTKVLIHMVDMSSSHDPKEDYDTINEELKAYGMHLIDRPQLVVASKVDDEEAMERAEKFSKAIGKEVIPICALNNMNIERVLYKCLDLLKDAKTFPIYAEEDAEIVYDLDAKNSEVTIEKVNQHTYRIANKELIDFYRSLNLSEDQGLLKLLDRLNKAKVDEVLEKAGAKNGDTIILDDYEFEYYE